MAGKEIWNSRYVNVSRAQIKYQGPPGWLQVCGTTRMDEECVAVDAYETALFEWMGNQPGDYQWYAV